MLVSTAAGIWRVSSHIVPINKPCCALIIEKELFRLRSDFGPDEGSLIKLHGLHLIHSFYKE